MGIQDAVFFHLQHCLQLGAGHFGDSVNGPIVCVVACCRVGGDKDRSVVWQAKLLQHEELTVCGFRVSVYSNQVLSGSESIDGQLGFSKREGSCRREDFVEKMARDGAD